MVGRVSPSGLPLIRVRLGALSVTVYDRDALQSYAGTWTRAAALAPRLFADHRDAFQTAEVKARRREAERFQKAATRP
jgi:hypothetical protein